MFSKIEPIDFLAQSLGFGALIIFMIAFQIKDSRKTQLLFVPGNFAYAFQYFLMGSMTGGLILFASAIRNLAGVYASAKILNYFIVGHVLVAATCFALLGQSWAEALVLLSSVLSGFATFYRDDFNKFRFFIIGRQLSMLSFNVWIGSIAGMIHLMLTLGSNIIGVSKLREKLND
jgi:hypothetical protein